MTPNASARVRRILTRRSRLPAARVLALLTILSAAAAQAQITTATAISMSPANPSVTTPAVPGIGTPLTPTVITATVTEVLSGKPVTSGTVTFYDQAPLDRTLGPDILGVGHIQGPPLLVANGLAQITIALGAGQHNIVAFYSGTGGSGSIPNWVGSSSPTLQPYVTGQEVVSTMLNPVGVDGVSFLTDPTPQALLLSDVFVYGYGMQYPTGSVSVVDETENQTYPSTQYSELYASLGQTFSMDAPAPGVTSFILADPFHAGVPTIVAFYSGLNAVYTIDVNRKQSGGTAASAAGCGPCNVAASPVQGVAVDVNNDGLPDLVIAHEDTTGAGVGVGILMNTLAGGTNAYGTAEVTYQLGHPIAQVAVGDLNSDGYPDIVALTSDGTNLMIVLLNDGAGHFTKQSIPYLGGHGASQIALGDFRNNGILDLVVLNPPDNTFGILSGQGTGTFSPMVTYQASPTGAMAVPAFLAITHLGKNGVPDPYLDIAVISQFNFVNEAGLGGFYEGGSVFYGNGDDSFNTNFFVSGFGGSTSSAPTGFIAKDLDGDGIPDLIVSNPTNVFFPYMYNVNGTNSDYNLEDGYTGMGTAPVDYTSVGVAAGDLNGDGVQDIVLMNPSNANFPGTPAKDSITLLMGTLYSLYTVPDLIASPAETHMLAPAYTPAPGSIYAPSTGSPVSVTVPLPAIATITPSSMNFGNVMIGSTASQTFTVTDTGTGNLIISFDYLQSTGAIGYSITSDSCAGAILVPTASCMVTIQFAPTTSGPQPTAFQFDTSQVGSPQIIPIAGSGTSIAGSPNLGTTIVLTVPNTAPNYVTPTNGGAGTTLNPVTLTATVTVTSTGLPVTGGSVTFYDNPGVPGAAGPSPIGSTNLQFPVAYDGVANGVATLPFAFGPGPHSLTATYSGTPVGPPAGYGYAPSMTASSVSLNSNGFAAETFGFQLLGNAGTIAYFDPQSSLSQVNFITGQDPVDADSYMYGYGMQIPVGTSTATDQTTGITYPLAPNTYAGITYNAYFPELTVMNAGGYLYGDYIYSLPESGVGYYFVADIFNSGVPALITLSATQSQIWTNNLYSNPNSYPGCEGGSTNGMCAVTTPPVQGLAADINGDGFLDLVIAHNDPSGAAGVGVLTNTLRLNGSPGLGLCPNSAYSNLICAFGYPEVTYATGYPEGWVQVGDVNGDGYPDIVALSSDGSKQLSVLLNNGDGTFTTSPTTFTTGIGAQQFYLTDLNRDGILDIGVLNLLDQTLGILLGNGDGTFQTMVPYYVGANPTSFAVADLNLDGFVDFAITNNDNNPQQAEVSFLYGLGDGTFNYVSDPVANALYMNTGYPEATPMPTVITATDLNGDGYPDLFIGYNINQYSYAIWSPSQSKYIYSENAYYDEPNGINFRTNSLPVADLDGDGVKDELYMPLINNNITCGGCSPSNNNLMVRTNGSFAYGWYGPSVIDSPVGNHTFYSSYTPPANSIYQAAPAGPITIPIGAEPILVVTPLNLSFGLVQDGTTTAPMIVMVQNTGNGPLTNLSGTVEGQNVPGTLVFDGFDGGPNACPTTINPGDPPCQVTVVFSPVAPVDYTAVLVISYTGAIPGSSGAVEVSLSGFGSSSPVGNVNVNETIHLTDTNTAAIAHPVSVRETIILTDSVTPPMMAHRVPVNETIHLTDTVTPPATAHRVPVSETIHLTDTITPPMTAHLVPVNETIHLTDTVTPPMTAHLVPVNETIHLTDAVTAANTVFITQLETIHVTDTPKPLVSIAILDTETIHVTDVPKPLLSIAILDSETIHVIDVPTPLLSIAILDPESIHVTDAVTPSVDPYTDTTKLTVSATAVPTGGSVGLTATVSPSGTTTAPTGTVNFYDGSTLVGSGTLSGGVATFTETGLGVGLHTIYAAYSGISGTFPASTSASVQVNATSSAILAVTPVSVSRNFATLNPTLTYNITGFTGGDTISVVSGAPVLSTTAGLNSPAGGYPITATTGTLSAPSKYVFSFDTGTLTVNGGALQTITFAVLPNVSFSSVQHETLTAHSSSGTLGQPIVYMVTGPATISGSTLTLTGPGSVTVTATQAGNATFNPAMSIPRTFTVTP